MFTPSQQIPSIPGCWDPVKLLSFYVFLGIRQTGFRSKEKVVTDEDYYSYSINPSFAISSIYRNKKIAKSWVFMIQLHVHLQQQKIIHRPP